MLRFLHTDNDSSKELEILEKDLNSKYFLIKSKPKMLEPKNI